MKLDVDVIGEERVLANLKEMRARARDARPATRKVKELMIEANRKQFSTQGGYSGDPWPPLAKATLERKSREGIDLRPMHGKTGALAASLGGGRGKKTSATKSGARAGTKVWYGVFARGTKGGEPTRKLVAFTHADQLKTVRIISDYVVHDR